MSVTVYGRHDDDAVFEDDNGPARIPLRALALLHHAADMGRTEYATWQGPPVRRFHRDDLRRRETRLRKRRPARARLVRHVRV
jgi:hypothetical protein